MFLGAGASKAAQLPLTEELLSRIYPRTGSALWQTMQSPSQWRDKLEQAFTVLYPDGAVPGFRPNVSDFFTVLQTVATIHEGRERLPIAARDLLSELRSEIALGLRSELSSLLMDETPHYRWFTLDNAPQVVVTSNWDGLVERAAIAAGYRVCFQWPLDTNGQRRRQLRQNTIVVLKIHGSVDWGLNQHRTLNPTPLNELYSDLSTKVGEDTQFGRAKKPAEMLLRFRPALESSSTDRNLGFEPPLMATMGVGKDAHINAIEDVWNDAYWCLSRAKTVDVVGYSFPQDDLEIRTLLRTTTRQPGRAELAKDVTLTVCNPSPQAHARARSFLGVDLLSDYRSL